jgi:hypothetical protein
MVDTRDRSLCLRVAPGIRSAGSCWHQGWISPTCSGFDLPEGLEQAFAGYDVSASQRGLAPPAVALDRKLAHLMRGDARGA